MAKTLNPPNVRSEQIVDFAIYAPPAVEKDYHASWIALQEGSKLPLVWTPHNGGHWIVLRSGPMKEVWSDHERFSNQIQMVPKSDGERNRVLPSYLDPPEYGPYRKILTNALAPKRVMEQEKTIRSRCASLSDGFLRDGQCDFVAAYAEQLPIGSFIDMFDMPIEDSLAL